VQIFKQGLKSYKDLPIRMAEFGSCFRNEPSGSLHGIMRVRAFVQDDAHIFCTPDQIGSEVFSFCELLKTVYKDLGFDEILIKFSTRPEVRAGTDESWDLAEKLLGDAANAAGINYQLNPGEGAFYGPKLEFTLKDALSRQWQCGTLQLDSVLPERLDATYIGEDGKKHRPIMLHRAVLGSLERFIGVLIEHYAGKLPLWLTPLQVVVATITGDADDYARSVAQKLHEKGIRVELDLRNEKISYKVREHSLQKIPFIFVVGKNEALEQTIALRRLGGDSQENLSLNEAILKICDEVRPPVQLI
jgi:threonyl-tRNA synthetase